MKEKTIAIIVTFNRKELLAECLEGVFAQTYKVDKVIIADNASTDGTRNFLKERGILDREDVIYLDLRENLGASGGFHEGIRRAQEEGAEWLWLLDDDVDPETNCLETLLYHSGDEAKCLQPLRKYKDGTGELWEQRFNPKTCQTTSLRDMTFKKGGEVARVNVGCFEGMLIHKDVVSKIGLPDKRFFIVWDDVLYGFLASLETKVLYVRDAVMTRALKGRKSNNHAYYYFRNRFLMREYLNKKGLYNPVFFWGMLLIALGYYSLVVAIKSKSLTLPLYAIRGVYDGVLGRFGKRED